MRKIPGISAVCVVMVALVVLIGGTRAQAQVPGSAAYLHAISDLRSARGYLEADQRTQGPEGRHIAEEITKAIREIKNAAIDDGKDLDYVPPTDSRGMAAGPLHEALRLIRKAHDDCAGGIDMPNAVGMKMRALRHIDEAQDRLSRLIQSLSR